MSVSEEFMEEIDRDWAERGSNENESVCPKCGEPLGGDDPHWWTCED